MLHFFQADKLHLYYFHYLSYQLFNQLHCLLSTNMITAGRLIHTSRNGGTMKKRNNFITAHGADSVTITEAVITTAKWTVIRSCTDRITKSSSHLS